MNNTYIKVGLPGGREGTFTVEVNHKTNGDSIAGSANSNIFNYAFTVSSVSPSTGSIYGNTLLTITGQNFVTDSQNTLAYVGYTLNWFCVIENLTSTEIKCRTPPISTEYEVNETLNVLVSTRLLILSKCTGNCSFSYINITESPTITSISSSTVNLAASATATITITGTNLVDSNAFADVALIHTITKVVTVITPTSKNDSTVTFDVSSAL